MYLKGALDSAQIIIAWEKQLSSIKRQQENLANLRLMISNICKHKPSKHNELRCQIKKHEIAKKLKKNNLQPYSPNFLFFNFYIKNKHIMLSEENTKEHKEV
jgi:hypothetical protein